MDINKPPVFECMPPYQTQGIRGHIIGMHDAGASIRTIACHLSVPPTTVHDTVRQFWECGHLDNLPIPGRPCKLNERGLRELARVIQQNHCETQEVMYCNQKTLFESLTNATAIGLCSSPPPLDDCRLVQGHLD
ncbi:hypothetical protein O181_082731 [Austropuccinia psidii MF-1]|uniref:Paired domain-containing protein n=1 Tax=Austropuccinia psidii MF-1 TaxID=1389203 RepID=A0A9Q3FMN8_9BASI|nr:hypothetical protein [Austropuccinia psidii MF-1]